jgi:hypothetical protein
VNCRIRLDLNTGVDAVWHGHSMKVEAQQQPSAVACSEPVVRVSKGLAEGRRSHDLGLAHFARKSKLGGDQHSARLREECQTSIR